MLLSKESEIWGPELLVEGAENPEGQLRGEGVLFLRFRVGLLCEYCSVKL